MKTGISKLISRCVPYPHIFCLLQTPHYDETSDPPCVKSVINYELFKNPMDSLYGHDCRSVEVIRNSPEFEPFLAFVKDEVNLA